MTFESRITIIQVRGREYKKLDYDWYIDQALKLAPASWTYEEVVSLRDAIRENYNHGWDMPVENLAGNGVLLKQFINAIIGLDRFATIRSAPGVYERLPFEPESSHAATALR